MAALPPMGLISVGDFATSPLKEEKWGTQANVLAQLDDDETLKRLPSCQVLVVNHRALP
jgi:hypothetical protein